MLQFLCFLVFPPLVLNVDGSNRRAESSQSLARLFQPPVDIMFRGSLSDVSRFTVRLVWLGWHHYRLKGRS